MSISHLFYLLTSALMRLPPITGSNYAERTLDRYEQVHGYSISYYKDQKNPRFFSIYWQLVRARNREKYFQAVAASYVAKGLVRNTISMNRIFFFGLMTWIGLSHSLPQTLVYIRQLMEDVL